MKQLKPATVQKIFDIAVVILYAAVTFAVILHHEGWRDEAQPWLLVRDSEFWELVSSGIRFQQHPYLWYLILFPFAKLGFPYFTQYIIHWLIAVFSAGLLVMRSPLPRYVAYPAIFSYYLIYEYAVIARNYALGILLLFLIAAFYKDRFKRPFRHAFLIALLFNANFSYLAAGCALTALFIWEIIHRQKEKRWPFVLSAVLMGAGLYAAAASALFVPQESFNYHHRYFFDIRALFDGLGRVFFPCSWCGVYPFDGIVTFGFIAFSCLLFAAQTEILLAYLGSLAGVVLGMSFFHFEETRHVGAVLILMVFFFWISRCNPNGEDISVKPIRWKGIDSGVMQKVFVAVFLSGIALSWRPAFWMVCADIHSPFSGSKDAAAAIEYATEKMHSEGRIVVVHRAALGAPVAAYLPGQKFWYADTQAYGSYWPHVASANLDAPLSADTVLANANREFSRMTGMFFLFSGPLDFTERFGYEFKLLHFSPPTVFGSGRERYYLYLAIPAKSDSG